MDVRRRSRWSQRAGLGALLAVSATTVHAAAQVITDPTGNVCIATAGESIYCKVVAVSNGGSATTQDGAAVSTSGDATGGGVSVTGGSGCSGGNEAIGVTCAGRPGDPNWTNVGVSAEGSAQGVDAAISPLGNSSSNGLAISGTGTATGQATVTGTQPSTGSLAAISGTGSSSSQELAVSGTGSAKACGGPFPIEVSGTFNDQKC